MAEQAPLSIRRLVIRASNRQQAENAAASLRRGLDGFVASDVGAAPVSRSLRLQVSAADDPGQAAAGALRTAIKGGNHGG